MMTWWWCLVFCLAAILAAGPYAGALVLSISGSSGVLDATAGVLAFGVVTIASGVLSLAIVATSAPRRYP
jgi:hypothetical protein